MIFFIVVLSGIFAVFFYWQAFISGLACKRWALIGFILGPLAWPMFSMKKRMAYYQKSHFSEVYFRA